MPMTPSLLKRLKAPRTRVGPALYATVLSLVVLALSGAVGIVALTTLALTWLRRPEPSC